MANFTLHRRPGTAQYFTETHLKLEPDAIPLDMVQVPGGSFLMGSPENELDRMGDEGPQHEVAVSSFFMGRYPVTQAQWKAVAALPPIERELKPDPAHFKGNNRPVEQISWCEAVEFCQRLAKVSDRAYRLPTEAEWEYACRAGTHTPFYFGNTLTSDLANFDGNYIYGKGLPGIFREETTPVDYFELANNFGLHDMHGNVYEWCQDSWHANYEDAPTDGRPWISGSSSSSYVIRGGSWLYVPGNCRSASRSHDSPHNTYYTVGLRVVYACEQSLIIIPKRKKHRPKAATYAGETDYLTYSTKQKRISEGLLFRAQGARNSKLS